MEDNRTAEMSTVAGLQKERFKMNSWDDATWIMTSAFIVFTMQSGFGLLESGIASTKNEVNIMVKNAVDVIFGGLAYWAFGYAFSFGDGPWSNAFCGIGHFFVDANEDDMGFVFSHFFFQTSFATTATTIVSGAMAERTRLSAYMVFSFLNTLAFAFPSHWLWASNGWLHKINAVDIAGAGPVHLVGGVTGLIATIILKPRQGRFTAGDVKVMGSPTNAILGLFMLWWGWLGFNCGSTFGIAGGKWKLAARAAVATVMASMGGGAVGLLISYITKNRRFEVDHLIFSVLGALVSVTSMCALARPWEGLVIGLVGGMVTCGGRRLLELVKVDDPVCAVPVHGFSAIWGMLAVGLFARQDKLEDMNRLDGLVWGGGFRLLGVQFVAVLSIITWSAIVSYIILKAIDLKIGMRVSQEEERLGADFVEHGIVNHASELSATAEDFINNSSRNIDIPKQKYRIKTNVKQNTTKRSFPILTSITFLNSFYNSNVFLEKTTCPAMVLPQPKITEHHRNNDQEEGEVNHGYSDNE